MVPEWSYIAQGAGYFLSQFWPIVAFAMGFILIGHFAGNMTPGGSNDPGSPLGSGGGGGRSGSGSGSGLMESLMRRGIASRKDTLEQRENIRRAMQTPDPIFTMSDTDYYRGFDRHTGERDKTIAAAYRENKARDAARAAEAARIDPVHKRLKKHDTFKWHHPE